MGEVAGFSFYLALAEFEALDVSGVEAKAGSWLRVHLCCSLPIFFYAEPSLPRGLLLPSAWAETGRSALDANPKSP